MVPEPESLKIDAGWDDLAQARDGSQAAWRMLFERYSPRLLRMAALMTGSPDAARDCVQETFIRVMRSATPHRRGSFRAYLSTITYRLALKEKLRLSRQVPPDAVEPASTDPSPLDVAIADERRREIVRALLSLPTHHREVLVLRLHGEHSYEEIAEITGIPLGTVKSRIFHAVKLVRQRINNRGIK